MRWSSFFCAIVACSAGCARTTLDDRNNGDGDQTDDGGGRQLVVLPLSDAISDRWNVYVAYSGGPLLGLTGAACSALPTYHDCVHSGELRRVDVPGESSCFGVTAADSLGAFDWTCIEHDGVISLVSTGLADGKGLRDLIDFATPAFLPMHLTVSLASGPRSTTDAVWWSNPVSTIAADSGADGVELTATETIFVVPANRTTTGIVLTGVGSAIVTAPGAALAGAVGNQHCQNFEFGSDLFAAAQCVLYINGADRAWVEADVDGNLASLIVSLTLRNARSVRVHRSSLAPTLQGLITEGLQGARLTQTTVAHSGTVLFHSMDGSLLRDMRLAGSDSYFLIATNNTIENLTTFGNFSGVTLDGSNRNNHFIRLLSVAHSDFAVQFVHGSNTSNTFVGFTFADTGRELVGEFGGTRNTFHLGIGANTTQQGFDFNSVNDTMSNYVGVKAGFSNIELEGVTAWNRFSGNLLLGNGGNNCGVDTGASSAGLVDGTCSQDGLSSIGYLSVAMADISQSFAGPVANDPVNTSDAPAPVATPSDIASFDFAGASSRYIGWLPQQVPGLFDASDRTCAGHDADGCWHDTTQQIQLVDWRLAATDTLLRNTSLNGPTQNPLFVDGSPCPAGLTAALTDLAGGEVIGDGVGNDDGTCETGETCSGNTYLLGAIEVIDDYVGDDDGLCESSEACIYAPNFGAYQGEGDYVPHTCILADGLVTGVTMHGYPVNGSSFFVGG